MNFLPIFGYHRIVAHSRRGQYDFTQQEFEKHLEIFISNNLGGITYEDFLKERKIHLKPPLQSVMITFDDGYSSDFHIIYPLLQKIKFKATFFITANLVSRPGYLSWDEIRELSKAGMSIQSHSFNHVFLTKLKEPNMIDELTKSKDYIQEAINKDVHYIAVPGGRISHNVIKAAQKAGYKGVYTSKPGYNIGNYHSVTVFERFIIKNSFSYDKIAQIAQRNAAVNFKMNLIYTAKWIARLVFER